VPLSPARRRLACAALALLGNGCGSVGTWACERGLDLTDIVDLRYGTGIGLGVQLEATTYFGAGLGASSVSWTGAFHGRGSTAKGDGVFMGLVVVSMLVSDHDVGTDPCGR
jgi:hypothetical protein